MRLNFVKTILAIAISSLIAYGFYSFHNRENKILLSVVSFIFLAITLVFSIGISFELSRTTTNIRAVAGIFFLIALISNIIFSFMNFSIPFYVIINGILMLSFILIEYSINKAKQ
jgi:ABC-type glycerol-3-phosphate transport system permease component